MMFMPKRAYTRKEEKIRLQLLCMECKWSKATTRNGATGTILPDGQGLCEECRERLIHRPRYIKTRNFFQMREESQKTVVMFF